LAPTVKGFFPIVEQLLINGNPNMEVTTESIFYLTVAAIFQLVGKNEESKEIEKKIESDKLKFIDKIKKVLKVFKNTVNLFLKKSKMMSKNYLELFAYTSLFVPFAITFSEIINSNSLGITEFLKAFTKDFGGKLISTTFGVGVFTIKHFLDEIYDGLKKLKNKPKEIIKILKSKISKNESILSFDEYYLLVID
jgi:hypothetical protein